MAGRFRPYDDVDIASIPTLEEVPEDDDESYEYPEQSYAAVPAQVKDFLIYFRRQINSQNLNEIQSAYSNTFPKHTERFFKDQAWPEVEALSDVVDDDTVFVTLYRELYYRHIYARLQPTVEQRFESYENYCDLFNYILDSESPVHLELPNQWLWDITDEFIYQFQSFTQYRAHLSNKSEEEIAMLAANPQIWNVHIVLNVLHSLIAKSAINEQLQAYESGEDPTKVAGDFGSRMLYKMLGYFSIVGLLRLHTLLGDYYQALKVMEHIELNKKALYSRVSACQITIYYYVGFCYLMMRRYQDSVRTFTSILVYILRTQGFHQRSPGFNFLAKKRDQLFSLLAIAMGLNPQRIDESVNHQLWEKCGERMQRIQKGEEKACEELFEHGCPKFLSPIAPNYEEPSENFAMEPYNLQLKLFMQEVQQQSLIPTIRSYLKLYATMPLAKLASFMDQDMDKIRTAIHMYKHKATQLVWSQGSALDGTPMASTDVDFFIDGEEMVHVADVKLVRSYGEYFIHQINKISTVKDGSNSGGGSGGHKKHQQQ